MKPVWKIVILLCFLLLFLLVRISLRHHPAKVERLLCEKNKDTLVVAVRPNTNDLFLYRSEASGFHLEVVKVYAYTHCQPYRIYWETDEDQRWQALLNGEVTFLVCNQDDSTLLQYQQQQRVYHSIPLENKNNAVWVVNSEHQHLLTEANTWIAHYLHAPEYHLKRLNHFVLRNPSGIKPQTVLSYYDHLIKRYAKQLNWDWRLLASLIYQESRFKPCAESYRGAYGLMQIMPSTAQHFNIDNLDDPQSNMEGGTRILRALQREVAIDTASMYDNICFILAAYNAGANRIAQCRHFAATMGKDPSKWSDVASVIPLMKHPVYYENDENIDRFKGVETLNYVKEVMERFELYKLLLDE